MKLISKDAVGVWSFFGGLVNFDPDWRSRSELAALEPSVIRDRLLPKTRAELLLAEACETAIEFVTGKPGGGKGMLAIKLIVDELIHGHRPIVTNLPLNLPRLQEYVHECGSRVWVADRVRELTHEEVFRFYLIRGPEIEVSVGADGVIDWTPSQTSSTAAGGVFYVIDECHNYFHPGADGLKNFIGSPCFQWASQHRKLKDKCFFVTQSIENVHVAIRRLGQQFHYVRNLRKEAFRGFRRGDGFERTTYIRIKKSDEDTPIDVKQFTLDVKGLASCYYTAGGVGVKAVGVADGGSRVKGLHMRWLWWLLGACVLVIACALFLLPRLLAQSVTKATLGTLSETASLKNPSARAPVEERRETLRTGQPVAARAGPSYYGLITKNRVRYLSTDAGLIRVLASYPGGKYEGEDGVYYSPESWEDHRVRLAAVTPLAAAKTPPISQPIVVRGNENEGRAVRESPQTHVAAEENNGSWLPRDKYGVSKLRHSEHLGGSPLKQ